MKFQKSLLLGLTTGAIVLAANPAFSNFSDNNSFEFRCSQDGLTTVVQNKQTEEVEPLIHWKAKYIDSSTEISQACDQAAKTLRSRRDSRKPIILMIDYDSYQQTTVCLTNDETESCNLSTSEELLRLGKNVPEKALSEIIDPNLAHLKPKDLEASKVRGLGRIYVRPPQKAWWPF